MGVEKYLKKLKELGGIIKEQRSKAKVTYAQLEKSLDVGERQIKRYEAGDGLTVEILLTLSNVIGYDFFRHLTTTTTGPNLVEVKAIVNGVRGSVAATNSMLREILELLRDYEGLIGISSDELGPTTLGKNKEENKK